MINKTFLEDRRLSLKGKGLLAYCMSKPDGWQFSIPQLAKVLKEGRDSLYAGFQELIELGYCMHEQIRREDGTFGNSDYTLFETTRNTECLTADSTYTDNPDAGVPDAGGSDAAPYIPVKNDSSNKLKREGDKPPPLRPPNKFKKIERAPFVMLTDKEHGALVQKYGDKRAQASYQRLSVWKQDTPKSKWKKSDYFAIQRWVIDAVKEDEEKEKKRTTAETQEDTVEISNKNKFWWQAVHKKIHGKNPDEFVSDSHPDFIVFRNFKINNESEKLYFKNTMFQDLVKHEINKRKLI